MQLAFVNHVPLKLTSPARLQRTVLKCIATPSTTPSTNPSSSQTWTRRAFIAALASATGTLAVASITHSEVEVPFEVVKKGAGPAPQIGDLVGIRFKGAYNGVVFDNLFESSQPYYYRVGSEAGIDEVVQKMHVGDVFDVTIPGEKAFGAKGRRASPGKPAIPPNATMAYTVELSTIPGREDELLENMDIKEIGDTPS